MGSVVLLETAAETTTTTTRRQRMMTSLFLLMTLGLRGTVSFGDVTRQNNAIGDSNSTGKATVLVRVSAGNVFCRQ